eukprot:COSAG01_NODE_1088_length_11788_cov_12.741124_11_plen_131_part_00
MAGRPESQQSALDICGSDGQSALAIAAQCGHVAQVEALLAAGAAVNAPNPVTGRSPLHAACGAGAVEVVGSLLVGRADPRAVDHRGRTPLDVRARRSASALRAAHGWHHRPPHSAPHAPLPRAAGTSCQS